jgi:glycosyltransferase involved in cell wall biosynthesis
MDNFSIVIPVHNEMENIPLLAHEIEVALNKLNCDWECIWVDDGSTDLSWSELQKLGPIHKGLKLSRNFGQSSAIMAGCDNAKFNLIVTMDSDLQNDPIDIPKILNALSSNLDCVCGVRKDRNDKLISRKIPSMVANKLARLITGIKIKDLGCTLKVFRKHLIADSRLIGEMHRVLPIYFHMSGARISEIQVSHRPRKFGNSKYGLERIFKFMADILLAKVMNKLSSRPLYLFGSISLFLFFSGAAFLTFLFFQPPDFSISQNTTVIQFTFSAMVVFGCLIIVLLGLITEVIIRNVGSAKDTLNFSVIEEKK